MGRGRRGVTRLRWSSAPRRADAERPFARALHAVPVRTVRVRSAALGLAGPARASAHTVQVRRARRAGPGNAVARGAVVGGRALIVGRAPRQAVRLAAPGRTGGGLRGRSTDAGVALRVRRALRRRGGAEPRARRILRRRTMDASRRAGAVGLRAAWGTRPAVGRIAATRVTGSAGRARTPGGPRTARRTRPVVSALRRSPRGSSGPAPGGGAARTARPTGAIRACIRCIRGGRTGPAASRRADPESRANPEARKPHWQSSFWAGPHTPARRSRFSSSRRSMRASCAWVRS